MEKTMIFNEEEKQILALLGSLGLTEQIQIIEDSIAEEEEPMHREVLEGLLLKLKSQP